MGVYVASVGRLGRSPVADAIRHYEARAGRYWALRAVEVRQEPARSRTPAEVCEQEWARLRAAAPAAAELVVCDEGGETMTSDAFARWLASRQETSRDVVFAIGGAYGLPSAARDAASLVLALAPWTLAHDLARLVLAEQLYRAGTILRGEPYHK